ncbi:MAG TPA: PBP1A family penicillin-binding protein [Alphaproteobacteria bacterium]|nr:PBP1A family penicillin-binding protein [Alphaproteobacteria bacterium]
MAKPNKFLRALVWLIVLGILAGAAVFGLAVAYFSAQLPDFMQLSKWQPSLITKVYDRNGQIIAEFARERRVWVPIGSIPKDVVNSFLAAEDAHFYEHGGFDLKAILRATVKNALTDRTQGASTITQQVAKTFLLSSERTYTRKVKELILSWRIEKVFSKNEILELYLNRIYLGNGAYGVAAAAQTYFSKSLAELTPAERAMIAGLPQAPSRYNPVRNPDAALARRNIILGRMAKEGYISESEAAADAKLPLGLKVAPLASGEDAPHFSEYIRRQIEQQFGPDALYQNGLTIYTTLDLNLQKKAEQAVYEGLRDYDRRHGWRGPVFHLSNTRDWPAALGEVQDQYSHSKRIGTPAVVLKVGGDSARIGLSEGKEGNLVPAGYKWTGKKTANALLKVGDIVMVKPLVGGDPKKGDQYQLEQIPQAQGALMSIDVRSGDILAMVGGLGEGIGFNRAVQARRQVGSSFKPFVYLAALEKGYTPATTVLDAPVVFRTGDKEWKPGNYDGKMGGPMPVRRGLEQSRNLMTVRLAQDVGLKSISDVVRRVGVAERVPLDDLTVVLGSLNFSLMEMTNAYAVFPRGGLYIPPRAIMRVQGPDGQTLQRSAAACDGCLQGMGATPDTVPTPPALPAVAAVTPQLSYLMTSMLQGVVLRGTGYALNDLGRPLAGKTGTTNNFIDAWFVGFSPSVATGVWVGMDTPKSLGNGETGARAALPIWKSYMKGVLDNTPREDFAVPDGIDFTTIDRDTGYLPGPTTKRTMAEAFVAGTAPTQQTPADYYGMDTGVFGGAGDIFGGFFGKNGPPADESNPADEAPNQNVVPGVEDTSPNATTTGESEAPQQPAQKRGVLNMLGIY